MFRLTYGSSRSLSLLAFSDWRVQDHGDLLEILDAHGPVDAVLYAGDDLARFLDGEFDFVREYARRSTAGKLLLVAGNDDSPEEVHPILSHESAHDLDAAPFFFEGFSFFGVASAPGSFLYSERKVALKLKQHFKAILAQNSSSPTAVLVCHAPPFEVLDLAQRFGQRHIGSKSIRSFLDKQRVSLTICGHCHGFGGRRQTLSNGNVVLNIASHDDEGAAGRYAFIRISRKKLDIRSSDTREWFQQHPLSSLIQVGSSRLRHFLANGITGLHDVVPENREKLRVPGAGDWHIERWLKQAEALRGDMREIEFLDKEKLRYLLEPRFIVWDVETDLAQDVVWMIGAIDSHDGQFVQFFDADDEGACVRQFCQWVTARGQVPIMSWSGSYLDSKVLRRSIVRHGLTMFAGVPQQDIDVCLNAQYECLFPSRDFRVRQLAQALGFASLKQPSIDGFATGAAFTGYRLKKSPLDWTPYLEHNQDDVRCLHHVVERMRLAYARSTRQTEK